MFLKLQITMITVMIVEAVEAVEVEEAAEGLDPVKRVAMRLDLRRPAGAARRRQPKCCAR